MTTRERIVVAISGGVDSAVAALRLVEAGFDVHGLHMTNWDEADAYCTSAEDYQAARRACREIGIPLHRVNFSAEYRQRVFEEFLADYRAGRTPNPDVLCNRYIKFGVFLAHARRLGGQRIATGHYARLVHDGERGIRLLKGIDPGKDQTYFLHAVAGDDLASAIFPVGGLTKAEVRALANRAGLPNHDRPDSTGLCFIGERPFRSFLRQYLSGSDGPILTPEGMEIGRHDGLMFYTPGQRSGIGIGGRAGGSGDAWYVASKDVARNALIVVQGRHHPLLWSQEVRTGTPRWIGASSRLSGRVPMRCQARIRHRQPPAACHVWPRPDGGLLVRFEQPQWAPAVGQYAVFYAGEECLGGAIIEGSGHRNELQAQSA
jgi:tRNA-specific 2-thiouridylase